MNETFVLGVTGVIGSGKSTVCRMLSEQFGFYWIEADAVVHDLYRIGQPGYQKIKEYFGEVFVGKYGVNRGRLRRFVLKSPQKLWILSKLIHPLVAHHVNKKVVQLKRQAKANNAPLNICLEAVFFEEGDLGKLIDRLLIIETRDEILKKRLRSHDMPSEELTAMLKFQRRSVPESKDRLRNDSTLPELQRKLRKWYALIR